MPVTQDLQKDFGERFSLMLSARQKTMRIWQSCNFVFPKAETILDFSYLYIYLNLFFSPAPSLSKAFINLSDDKRCPREKLVSMTTT